MVSIGINIFWLRVRLVLKLVESLMMNKHDPVRSGRKLTRVSCTWISVALSSVNTTQLYGSGFNPELGLVSVWFCFQGFKHIRSIILAIIRVHI